MERRVNGGKAEKEMKVNGGGLIFTHLSRYMVHRPLLSLSFSLSYLFVFELVKVLTNWSRGGTWWPIDVE